MKRVIGKVMFLLVLFTGCQNPEERVLFSSNRSGNSDIFIMNKDGSEIRQITNSENEEWSPVWISKSKISYLIQNEDDIQVIEYDLDQETKSIIKHPGECMLDDKNYVYSPNGQKRLYLCNGNIYVQDNELATSVNITANLTGIANYMAWVGVANRVTFTSNHEGNNDIYIFDLDSDELKKLTTNDANDERGDISPDGNYLVFSSDRYNEGNQDILIKNLKTSELIQVTNSLGMELIARWSLDQKSVYFGSNKDGNWEIYRYDLENESTFRLTNNAYFDGDPRVR